MDANLQKLLEHSRTRVVFGASSLDKLGELARNENARHVLLVTDPGIRRAGHVDQAAKSLRAAGIHVTIFEGAAENPTTSHVDVGVAVAKECASRGYPINFLVGIGGGSAMDCAKGINFIFTNGGRMQDYWGIGKANKPMLPMIAIPTTAGTGSEAQSFALITDPATHQKMACGDPKAMCRVAILDPDLTRTQPSKVAAAAGIDAVAHAVETAGCTKRNDVSLSFSREAWLRLDRAFERAMQNPSDDATRADMLLGAHLAGCAIENSMLGAAHACANPLTARCGITHGLAVGAMLPHVVRFNLRGGKNPYASIANDADALAMRVTRMLDAARLARKLRDLGVKEPMLPQLAVEAAEQWTAKFNPVAVSAEEFLAIYCAAW
ncbi:MAG: iron-containing alcohol dehydrogenase [Planctomycetes bacterium]|nr:iron-containing alcohol dehydrogenase [Planctomycetota bacterium]MBI3835800.1 iron-containing alcohol dehydrogenase [Planctomycetota bacterium]